MVIKTSPAVENLQMAGGQLQNPLSSSGVNSNHGECFFWGLCKPFIASTDLWPQNLEMFAFLEMLAMVVSESSYGAFVYHRRSVGLHRHQRSCCTSFSTCRFRRGKTCFKTSDKDGNMGSLRDVSPSQGLLQSAIRESQTEEAPERAKRLSNLPYSRLCLMFWN